MSSQALPQQPLTALTVALLLCGPLAACNTSTRSDNAFVRRNLISNRHDPSDPATPPRASLIDPLLVNPWGAAIRPAGLGGHIWIANTGSETVTEYVGDVLDQSGRFLPLQQDALKVTPVDGMPVGQVFNISSTGFEVRGELCADDGATGCHPGDASYVGPLTAPAKFIVATEEGRLSAWTEGTVGGHFGRMRRFETVRDRTSAGALYRGLAIARPANPDAGIAYLYVANFGEDRIEVYDERWRPLDDGPGVSGPGAGTRFARPAGVPLDYRPFNVHVVNDLVYVTYAQLIEPGDPDFDADDPMAERACEGCGRLAAFALDGRLVRVLDGGQRLNAPWGIALAPADFGPFGGTLLVGNFGDGTVTAFDLKTGRAIDALRDEQGRVIEIEGLWELFFGNGVSLGRRDHLYWTAGYNEEEDGGFGSLHWSTNPRPNPR